MNTIENITCECGTTFQWESEGIDEQWNALFRPRRCDPCSVIIDAENERIEKERRKHEAETKLAQTRESTLIKILEITPPRYQQTDIEHPAFNRELWNDVSPWRPSDDTPFLGLIGVSGACKTRIAYKHLRDIVMESIKPSTWADVKIRVPTFHALTSPDFAQLVGKQFLSNSGPRGSWDQDPKQDARRQLDRLRECDMLFLDDLGKAKNTPSVAAELFAIIDHRHAHNLATIWTANSTPEEIVNGMSEDMAGPLAGRLIECSKIITIE